MLRKLGWTLGALLGAVVVLLAIMAVNAYLLKPSRQLKVESVELLKVDEAAVAQRLAVAVKAKTISSLEDPALNRDEFLKLHAHLKASFPKAHAAMTVEAVGELSLLYMWKGRDASAKPIVLLAHQDVVPIAPNTEAQWKQPPFGGVVADGYVWGRGAWDNKGNLLSMLEAVEALVAAGHQPRQTVYFFFGADEEVGGNRGAKAAAKLLAERGVKADWVLDEGLLVTEGVLKGFAKPIALIGLAEKGYLTVMLRVPGTPGHSSMPPPTPRTTAIGLLSASLAKLDDQQMPGGLRGISRDLFDTLAPEATGVQRLVLSNLWLTKPLVESQLAKGASTNAMLRTTTAMTVLQAGNKENVIPGEAVATINFRTLPGDTGDKVVQHVLQVVDNPAVKVEKASFNSEASKVASSHAPAYQLINRSIREVFGDVVVTPGMMIAATDSRHFDGVADNIYKFSPVRAGPEDLPRFHGTNERISLKSYAEMIRFYHRLLKTGTSAN